MKKGKTISELAVELNRQMETKKDYLSDTRNIELINQPAVNDIGKKFLLALKGGHQFTVNGICHDQIATRLQIPKAYYDRMAGGDPWLLTQNVNRWLQNTPERRMVRTIDGMARAFLSDKYRPLDNYDLAQAVLPVISDLGCKIESCELTERRLYIKCVNDKVEGEILKGDIVQAGVVISNSEVRCGSVKIEPMVYRLSCLNGLISADLSMRKYHVGRSGDDFERDNTALFYKDETRMADDKAFWLKVRDVVSGSLNEAIFKQITDKMKLAAGIKLGNDPIKEVEEVSKKILLSKDEQSNVLRFLIEGGDLTLYGMMNAITKMAQDVPDYDRSTDLERIAGALIEV